MKWYCFNQMNSGGYFVVNNKVCHRLFIEAESFDDAVEKAEELGCYWDGVSKNIDCPCCGNRWDKWDDDPVDLEKYKTEGYVVNVYDGISGGAKDLWEKKYRKYEVIKEPEFVSEGFGKNYVGKIRFNNIEEYAQYLADEYGWTVPDARIYYHNGDVKEVFNYRLRY